MFRLIGYLIGLNAAHVCLKAFGVEDAFHNVLQGLKNLFRRKK